MLRTAASHPVAGTSAKTPHSAVSVGTSNVELVPAYLNRVAVVICNDHATNVVYLSLGGTAVANQGIRLNAAGGSIVIDFYTGQISAIASGATTPVTFSEV